MSWKKISRPEALPQGAAQHRQQAAQQLVDWYTGGTERGDTGARLDFLTGRAERSTSDLIGDLGGTRAAARAIGAGESTIRDWRAGRHDPTTAHREALEKAARKATVDSLGGAKAVGQLTGRSAGSVRGWVRKPTTVKPDAVHRLNTHEVRTRHAAARQQRGQDPAQPLVMKTTGHVRVMGKTRTPEYLADRSVCHELSGDVQARIDDALARGDDPARVQQLIERDLTVNYAGLGEGLYDGQNYGFFLDRVDTIDMLTER